MDEIQQPEWKKITAEEFIKIWKGDYRNNPDYKEFYHINRSSEEEVQFKDCTIKGDIVSLGNYDFPHLHLDNCIIQNFYCSGNLKNIYLSGKTSIQNIQIPESGKIKNITLAEHSKVEKFHISGNATIDDITITQDAITNEFNITGQSKIGNFYISGRSKNGNFYISGEAGYFYITEYAQVGNFDISGKTGYFDIRNNAKTGNFDIYGQTGNFYLLGNSITSNFSIYSNGVTGSFEIKDKATTGKLVIYGRIENFVQKGYSKTGGIEIKGEAVVENFLLSENSKASSLELIDNSTMNNLDVLNNTHLGELKIIGTSVKNICVQERAKIDMISLWYLHSNSKQLIIEGGQIAKLELILDKPYQVKIKKFNDFLPIIQRLYFKGTIFPKDAFLHISDAEVSYVDIDSFLNNGAIVFNNITPKPLVEWKKHNQSDDDVINKDYGSTFRLVNSDLGNTQFINCSLHIFQYFIFRNTKILNVFIANTTLPQRRDITTVIPAKKNNNDAKLFELEQQRLALSQFKKIFDTQGDSVKANEYKAEELEAYRLYVLKSKRIKNQWIELTNLSFNRISGFYGNNWLQAVFVTLTVNGLFFWWYCYLLGYRLGNDWNMFKELGSYSFEFLNPIRKHSLLGEENSITPGARTVDYISRVFIAYFAYQTIQAFRKFGKKGI